MRKVNFPKVVIRYLAGVQISCSATTLKNDLSRESELTSEEFKVGYNNVAKYGKKGFYLSGGCVEEPTQEVSGCLMDGTYTFFDNAEKYPGIVGTELSKDDYTFASEQSITVATVNSTDCITAISVKFDDVAGEYATDIKLSTEPNTVYKNRRYAFIKTFSEKDNVKSVKITFVKWNKKNSLAKVLKVTTSITGEYDYRTIKSLSFSDEKISNEEEVSFGVTNQFCDIGLIDKTGDINALHEANMLDGDAVAQIYLVNIDDNGEKEETQIGSFTLSTYENEKGTVLWNFSLVDKLEKIKDIIVEPHEVEKMTIKQITDYVLEKLGFNGSIYWEMEASRYCSSVVIPNAWVEPNQYAYDMLCKCCEVGLLRIFINPDGNVRIERGL